MKNDTVFVQFHWMWSLSGALPNRDDSGAAKRIPYGGVDRARISSQCMKRAWRVYEGPNAISQIESGGEIAPLSVRSRLIFDRDIYRPLVEEGVDEVIAREVTTQLMALVLGSKDAKEKKNAEQE